MSTISLSQTNSIAQGVSYNDVFFYHFQNNGIDNMNVNGLTTPKIFTLPLPIGSSFLLNSLSFVIGADEVVDLNKFGNVSALTNGIEYAINGALAGKIKTNGDVVLVASSTTVNSSQFASTARATIIGRWDFTDTFSGNCPRVFNNELSITIKDNLSTMPYFRMGCHGVLFDS